MFKKLIMWWLVVAVLLPTGNLVAEEIVDHVMTRDPKSDTGCETPIETNTFLRVDDRVYSWLAAKDIIEGDVVKWEWYDPDSTLFEEGTYTATFSGNGCAWYWIPIKDDLPADMPGDWHVDVFYNDIFKFTENFTIRSLCPVSQIYGDASAKTELVRKFRDKILKTTPEGRDIITLYYQWGPVIVKAMKVDEDFKQEIKEMIDEILPMLRKTVN
jgi:hypothetical protein